MSFLKKTGSASAVICGKFWLRLFSTVWIRMSFGIWFCMIKKHKSRR